MSYNERNYRHRNPRGKEENQGKTPFFNAPKNAVNRKKKKESIQRLATSKEDEKLSTNDARMEKDKEDPLKPVQKKDAPKKGKKEEEKPVQKAEKPKKDKEEKPVRKKEAPKKGKKEEEKPVQKKDAPKKGKKEEEKPVQKKASKEEEKPVQKKEEKKTTSARVAQEIKQQLGKGSPLPPKVLAEMNKSLGADLTGVCIHTDVAAAKLCRDLHAVAFTHGRDIFFDGGRYNPESPEGKKLLVHELTHVIQQSNADNES